MPRLSKIKSLSERYRDLIKGGLIYNKKTYLKELEDLTSYMAILGISKRGL